MRTPRRAYSARYLANLSGTRVSGPSSITDKESILDGRSIGLTRTRLLYGNAPWLFNFQWAQNRLDSFPIGKCDYEAILFCIDAFRYEIG